ncbi:MAG: hypothetical protein LQ346_008630 [Caloplaca aetnensis]|nr:MAG: hypothetical protein LQ346_008630 [Caloplaca aetnensis]
MGVVPKRPHTRLSGQQSGNAKVRPYLKTRYSENYINDLTNPINPIFDFGLWENVTSRKFLQPVLRLASLMLESPASQRLLYSLINPDRHRFLDHREGNPRCHFRKSAAAEAVVHVGVRIALQQLAKSLTYRWYKKLPQGVGTKAYGATYFDWPNDVGDRCHIGIRSEGFEKTFFTSTRRKKATDVNRWRFVLASTLCHEIAHALDGTYTQHCNRGSVHAVEHLYEYQTECELGWAWEMEVLGAIRIGSTRVRDLEVLQALPSLDQNYEELDLEGEQHFCFVIPTVSLVDYMTRVQRQKFWDTSPRTATMLRISTQPDRSFTGRPDFQPGPSQIFAPRPLNLISRMKGPIDPFYHALAERAKWDNHVRALLVNVCSGKATKHQIESFQRRNDAFTRRRYVGTLIRRFDVRRLITDRQEETPEPEVCKTPPAPLRRRSCPAEFKGSSSSTI